MSKRVDHRRRQKAVRTAAPWSNLPAVQNAGNANERLAVLLDGPHLARIVPQLAPDVVYQLIQHRGLEACGAVLAASTPQQLASILDLDLWHATPGGNDRFDEQRFGSWIETLMEEGEEVATRVVAAMGESLAVSGLSHHVRVFDPGVFEPTFSSDDDLPEVTHSRCDSVESEVGGYIVRAKTTHAWDAIVGLLVALADQRPEFFHELMDGCKRVSNSIPERDGLDDLLLAPEQLIHEVSLGREGRRTNLGYLTAGDARAFLQMARQRRSSGANSSSSLNGIAAAYFRALDTEVAPSAQSSRPGRHGERSSTDPEGSKSIDAVVDLLAQAGITSGQARALLGPAGARTVSPIQPLMEYLQDTDQLAYFARSRELGFLTNALLAGCSMHFTVEEAWNAAAGVCNVGLEGWPARWPEMTVDPAAMSNSAPALPAGFLVDHDLLTAFEAGWKLLHENVSMFVAERLIATLSDLRSVDTEIERDLNLLRRELEQHRDAPWRAREALEVIAILDMPTWASLRGLLGECPVWPAALTALLERHAGSVSATAFECFTTKTQCLKVREFVGRLPGLLLQ